MRFEHNATLLAATWLIYVPAVNATSIVYTAEAFTNVNQIANGGVLVSAVNLGNTTTAVTVNGVLFGIDPVGTGSLIVDFPGDFTSKFLHIPASSNSVTGMTATEEADLLDSIEFGMGGGSSRFRFDGLIVGQPYDFQLILVDDRPSFQLSDYDFGHSTPSGDAFETYTLLDVDPTRNMVQLVAGTFTASQTSQDGHVSQSLANNAQISAFQLRTIPTPAAAWCALALPLLTCRRVSRRMRRAAGATRDRRAGDRDAPSVSST